MYDEMFSGMSVVEGRSFYKHLDSGVIYWIFLDSHIAKEVMIYCIEIYININISNAPCDLRWTIVSFTFTKSKW